MLHLERDELSDVAVWQVVLRPEHADVALKPRWMYENTIDLDGTHS